MLLAGEGSCSASVMLRSVTTDALSPERSCSFNQLQHMSVFSKYLLRKTALKAYAWWSAQWDNMSSGVERVHK